MDPVNRDVANFSTAIRRCETDNAQLCTGEQLHRMCTTLGYDWLQALGGGWLGGTSDSSGLEWLTGSSCGTVLRGVEPVSSAATSRYWCCL